MPVGQRTSTQKQLQILALVVRGDSAAKIAEITGIPKSTVDNIRNRNHANIQLIKSRLIEHEVSKSKKILDKSQGIMDKKLTRLEKNEDIRQDALQALETGAISHEEYNQKVSGLTDVTLTELNSVAKEAFNQSQIEMGKPTSISASTQEAKDDLVRLVDELKKEHNEEELLKLIFDRDLIEAGQ